MQLHYLYEDKDFVAINKPAGVLFDWALASRPDLLVVHRLDKDTSGIILFAKNENAADYFKKLFSEHEIQKTYLALVVGRVKNQKGVIDLPIGRSKKTPLRRVAVGERRGKIREARTEYVVRERFEGFTLVSAYPKTGRTHQIRSHFAALGHPVACDMLYSGKRAVCPGKLARHFLHAAGVEFLAPSGGKIRIDADMPEDLARALDAVSADD